MISDEGCAGTSGCKRDGLCTVMSGRDDAWCAVQSDDDCAQTPGCKRFGACQMDEFHDAGCVVADQDEACELGDRLPIARVEVPSTQAPFKRYRFDATNLFDDKLDTSWQPKGAKRGGAGVKLRVELKAAATVGGVTIRNGFQRTDALGDLFAANSRIELAGVTVSPDARGLITFDSLEKVDSASFPAAAPTKVITIEVLSVHPGARWKDLAISEIEVFGCKRPSHLTE